VCAGVWVWVGTIGGRLCVCVGGGAADQRYRGGYGTAGTAVARVMPGAVHSQAPVWCCELEGVDQPKTWHMHVTY
jgi:hypothetical protein